MRKIKFRAWIDGKKLIVYPGRSNSCSDLKPGEPGGFDLSVDTLVEQFTGLLDKNGKEIYEGDIVKKINSVRKYEVQWYLLGANFRMKDMKTGHVSNFYSGTSTGIEVIGNIHQNQDLLNIPAR